VIDNAYVTAEYDGRTHSVTILDDTGKDADIELLWDVVSGERFFLRQYFNDNTVMLIAITPLQASYLKDVLQQVLIVEDK
jgi:hypothetical protein